MAKYSVFSFSLLIAACAVVLAASFLYFNPIVCEVEKKVEQITRNSLRRVAKIDERQGEVWTDPREEQTMSVVETKDQLREAVGKATGKPVTLDVAMGLITRRHQGRKAHDKETENKYRDDMERGDTFPAGKACVSLTSWEIDLYDGNHTLGALRQRKVKSMSLRLVPGDERTAKLWSFGANEQHGKLATDDDRVHALRILLDDPEWGRLGNAWLAKAIKASEPFIAKYRAAYEAEKGILLPGEVRTIKVVRNGKAYEQRHAVGNPKEKDDVGTYAKRVARKAEKFDDAKRARFVQEVAKALGINSVTA